MSTVTELACLLSSALESPQPDAQHVCGLLAQLLQLLDSPGAATELDDLICDLHGALVHAAQLSPAAEAHVRRLLAAAAEQCTAREVFTLCMSTLSQQLRSVERSQLCSRVACSGCSRDALKHTRLACQEPA